jgi:hypothetical protein
MQHIHWLKIVLLDRQLSHVFFDQFVGGEIFAIDRTRIGIDIICPCGLEARPFEPQAETADPAK